MKYCKVINKENTQVIVKKAFIANGFWSRLKGLLGKNELPEGEGLLLYPCGSIHCVGMKFPIDVIFLDEKKQIVHIEKNMEPGSKAMKKGARYVLEVKAGTVNEAEVKVGDVLVFCEESQIFH